MLKRLFFYGFIFYPLLGWSWSAPGHRVVSEVAYIYLTPKARQMVGFCTRTPLPRGMSNAAVWFDTLRKPEDNHWKAAHYINLPFSMDGTLTKPPKTMNAVTALSQATRALQSGMLTEAERCFNIKLILHVVGDIHQPMHAVSAFRHDFPEGDFGGNRYTLGFNPVANNLHAYWDTAGGKLHPLKKYKYAQIRYRAKRLVALYPCQIKENEVIDFQKWANESFEIAKTEAYRVQKNRTPSRHYAKMVQNISEARLALAGCRLARVLNELSL